MKPINPWLFYLVNFLVNLKDVCLGVLFVCGIVMALTFWTDFVYDDYGDEKNLKANKKTKKRLLAISVTLLIVFTFIPTRKTCYQMMIASQVTEENILKAEDTIKKSVDYIFEKINEK